MLLAQLLAARARAPTPLDLAAVSMMTKITTPRSSANWPPRRATLASTTLPHRHEARATMEATHLHLPRFMRAVARHPHTDLAAMASSIGKPTAQAHGNGGQDMSIDARASTRSRWARLSIRTNAPRPLSNSNSKINKTDIRPCLRLVYISSIHTRIYCNHQSSWVSH